MPRPETRLQSLTLRDFRCFKEVSIHFRPDLTVLVADNGGGKTALLDAVGIAIGAFVSELAGQRVPGIARTDVRLARSSSGAMVPMLPTTLDAEGTIAGATATWRRRRSKLEARPGVPGRTADEIAIIARSLRNRLMHSADENSPAPPLLPLIAYYGTGRLWSGHKLTKGKHLAKKGLTQPTAAYVDCLSPSSSYGHFVVWFENVVREAQNESQTGIRSPHHPGELLQAVRRAVDIVLEPTGWERLDWDFLQSEIVAQHPDQGRLPVSLLSDGIRNLIALVADLAHRAVRLNPHLGARACEESTGIVLIDEVDMHLHPSWQQTVIASLRRAFPQVQLIVTTHSHLVVSTVRSESIRVLQPDGTVIRPPSEVQGAASPHALAVVFGVDTAPRIAIVEDLSRYRSLVEQGLAATEEAQELHGKLREHFGPSHPVMVELAGLLRLQRFKSMVAEPPPKAEK